MRLHSDIIYKSPSQSFKVIAEFYHYNYIQSYYLFIFLSFSFFLLPSFIAGLTTQMPVREHRLWTRTLEKYTREGLPEICGQQNSRATASYDTGQNTDKGHTLSSRIEIKIPDPAGNRNLAVGLEGRDSTEHTATDPI